MSFFNPSLQVYNVDNDTHEKENTMNPIYDHEVITLSPVQEENFRQNLDDLLQQLDTETKNFENKEKEKIARLEDKKALYLQRAEEMGKKNKGESDYHSASTIQNSKFKNRVTTSYRSRHYTR